MSNLKLSVLYQFNNRYAPYAGVSITSLLENNKHFDEMNIYIFDDSMDAISPENRKKFNQLAEKYNRTIKILNTDPLIEIMKQTGIPKYRGSYSTNMKMFVSEMIPEVNGKLIYIDSDTVVPGSLEELAALDMQGNCLAMVLDSVAQPHRLEIGMREEQMYFNAGIILFDMKRWREEKCTERIIDHVKNVRAHYPAPDQDLINLVIGEKILKISPKYNLQPAHMVYSPKVYLNNYQFEYYYSGEELSEASNDPRICHCFRYLGEFPWHEGNLHPCNSLFDMYLRKSLWSDYKKERAEVGVMIRIEKILYRVLPKSVFIKVFRIAHQRFLAQANQLSLQNKNDEKM